MRPRTYKFYNPVWNYYLHVRVGGTRVQAHNWCDSRFSNTVDVKNVNGTCFTSDTEKSHLLWFPEFPNSSVVAHEALHSVQHVLSLSGLGYMCEANAEAYAYLLEWTVRVTMIRLNEAKAVGAK